MVLTILRGGRLRILAVLAITSILAAAASGAEDPLNLEARLTADAADGQLDHFTLLEAGLIASGVDSQAVLNEYTDRLGSHLDALHDMIALDDSTMSRAVAVMRFLHDDLLVGSYNEAATEITRLLDAGDFNCVSATLLYQHLCRVCGLAPVAVATSTHVRSRFAEPGLADVETTCPRWFELARDGSREAAANRAQPARTLDDIALVGKIYYNRGVSLLEDQQFAPAIDLLQRARRFDPQDASADENLLAAINNWALFECGRRRFARASALIINGLASHPDYAPFAANDLYIHQQWALYLCGEQHFGAALDVLQRAHQRRPEVELFDRGRVAVCAQWSRALSHLQERDVAVNAAD